MQLHNSKCDGIGGDFEKIAEMYMFHTFAQFCYTLNVEVQAKSFAWGWQMMLCVIIA